MKDRSIPKRQGQRLLTIVLPLAIQCALPAVGLVLPAPATWEALVEGLIKQVG